MSCSTYMKNLEVPVGITSAVLFLYVISPYITPIFAVIFSLFLITNILVIWMVIRILKDGTPSTKTFDEYFYEESVTKRV